MRWIERPSAIAHSIDARFAVDQCSLSSEGTVESPPLWHEMGPQKQREEQGHWLCWCDSLLAGGVSGGLWMSDNRGGRWLWLRRSLLHHRFDCRGRQRRHLRGTGSYFDFNYGNGDSGGRGRESIGPMTTGQRGVQWRCRQVERP